MLENIPNKIALTEYMLNELKNRPSQIEKKTKLRKVNIGDLTKMKNQYSKAERAKKKEYRALLQQIKEAELQKFGKSVDLEEIVKLDKNNSIHNLKNQLSEAQSKFAKALDKTNAVKEDFEAKLSGITKEKTSLLNEIARIRQENLHAKTVESGSLEEKSRHLTESIDHSNREIDRLTRAVNKQMDTLSRMKCEAKVLSRKDANLYETC